MHEREPATQPKDQLAALRQEFADEGFVIIKEWIGSILEIHEGGAFARFWPLNEDGGYDYDGEELMADFKKSIVDGAPGPEPQNGSIFYLTAYQDPCDETAQIAMTMHVPVPLTESELAEVRKKAAQYKDLLD
jgi:hypothetical protein